LTRLPFVDRSTHLDGADLGGTRVGRDHGQLALLRDWQVAAQTTLAEPFKPAADAVIGATPNVIAIGAMDGAAGIGKILLMTVSPARIPAT
jgi:hypothetical protein